MSVTRDDTTRVAVASRSFSRHPELRAELLARFSHVTFNDAGQSMAGDALVEFLHGHDRAIIALEGIDDQVLSRLPELRVISKYGVGLDNIDLDALAKRDVRLGWTPGVNSRSVAELVIALALISLRQLRVANDGVRAGEWQQYVGSDLHGRVVGIVGLGHVGKHVARLFQAFDCEIWCHDIRDLREYCAAHGIRECGLEELLGHADIVTVHLPLDASTRGMFDADRLGQTKPGAVLINTARGGIVDEEAVRSLLESGRLAAAAFDVFATEPPTASGLLSLQNFFATPHIGGSSREAILAMGRAAIDGLSAPADPAAFAHGHHRAGNDGAP